MPNTASDILPTLSEARTWVIGLMSGDRASFKRGYSHTNATIAVLDLCELRQVSLTDNERLLLPCFALGVARGLGSETATLEQLSRTYTGEDQDASVEAYNAGMIYGSWKKCLGDTSPAD